MHSRKKINFHIQIKIKLLLKLENR
jgi:hypothetical protein